ncbi:cytochrome c oxidase assembly protein COX16 homolog, mitochondrial-like isoform X1 [Biomphalaria glabrata]|uniref:Cytochrome c oxidase assembly protein COX16 homolog, mitochondrial n=1 Tax=Biomphalaria glabrata TaxID=6526 RepID=A0A9U8E5B2_BIOGL|nr:cytochrome c oxidase assembly protein COX16 homolog, mitochondrial-like isoform X1 [Biomphalaria glabrata]
MSATFRNVWDTLMKSKFLRRGIPFIIFVGAGSYYLKQFASIRYKFRQGKKLTPEEAEKLGIKTVDADAVCEEMLKEIEKKDLDDWQNIRGPRPWEDSKTMQAQQREKSAIR